MKINKLRILPLLFLNMILLSGCGRLLNASVGTPVKEPETENLGEGISYEITDIDRRTESTDETEIHLDQLAEGRQEAGLYTYEAGRLTICKGGDYLISGKSDDCNLVIQSYDDEIVHLIFDGVELHAKEGPVLYGRQAGKIIVTLKENTENVIYDSPEYASDAEACIFSNCDLTINGGGRLNVYGYYHDAVRSKDRVRIIGTDVYIRAKNNGIRGNDGVIIEESNVEAECEGTGIRTNSDQGYVMVQGGTLKLTAGENAIYSYSHVSIKDCRKDLYSVREEIRCSGAVEIDEGSTK